MIIRLQGNEVAYAYGYLANAYGLSQQASANRPLDPDNRVRLSDALDAIEQACDESRLDLPVTLAHVPRVREALRGATFMGEVQGQVGELRTRMHDELKSKLFLFIPTVEAKFYNQKDAFGPEVASRVPDAGPDIESAGDCIALGQNTAAVFHLMRAMERCVAELGRNFGFASAGEKNWQTILTEVNKAVAAMPNQTPEEKQRKADCAATASLLYSVKVAWRNEVMHPKASYSAEEAVEVYTAVRTFMKSLVSLL